MRSTKWLTSPPSELHLEGLEISLVLNNFNEGLKVKKKVANH